MVSRITLIFGMVLLAAIPALCQSAQQDDTQNSSGSLLDVKHTQNTNTIPMYEVFELTFKHEKKYANPFFDVTIEVIFTSPSKEQFRVGGFHYGASSEAKIRTRKTDRGERQQVTYHFDKQDLWKARFAPSQRGKWKYDFTFTNMKGQKASGKGAFLCVKGRRPNPGFVRRHSIGVR